MINDSAISFMPSLVRTDAAITSPIWLAGRIGHIVAALTLFKLPDWADVTTDRGPSAPESHGRYHGFRDPELPSKFIADTGSSWSGTNNKNLRWSEFRDRIFRTIHDGILVVGLGQSCCPRMLNVSEVGQIFEISKARVLMIAILVIDLLAFWRQANEGFGDQEMNMALALNRVNTQGHCRITAGAKGHPFENAPDLSALAGHNPLDATRTGDFVEAFIANNRSPFFFGGCGKGNLFEHFDLLSRGVTQRDVDASPLHSILPRWRTDSGQHRKLWPAGDGPGSVNIVDAGGVVT